MAERIKYKQGEHIPGNPKFKVDNIKDLLDSREAIIEMHIADYEAMLTEVKNGINTRRKMIRPSYGTFGSAFIPLVAHDPKRDKPDTLMDIFLFEQQKLTLFDASEELETRIPGAFERKAWILPNERQLPEAVLKDDIWTGAVVVGFSYRRRFGKPNDRFTLTHVNNPKIDGGKRILTPQGELKALGLDIKR